MDLSLPIISTSTGLDSFKNIRRPSRRVMVGDVPVGGGAPISVQTMTKTKTGDVKGTLEQIRRCEEAGVDIVRVTVNDWDAAEGIKEIVKGTKMPIVADIHINHVFAIKALPGLRLQNGISD